MGARIVRLLWAALTGSLALGTACAADPKCTTFRASRQRAVGAIDRPVEAVWVVDDAGHHPIAHQCLSEVVAEVTGGYAVKATCIVPSSPRCEDGRHLLSTCTFIVRPDGRFESVAVTHPKPVEACRP